MIKQIIVKGFTKIADLKHESKLWKITGKFF